MEKTDCTTQTKTSGDTNRKERERERKREGTKNERKRAKSGIKAILKDGFRRVEESSGDKKKR